MKTTFEFKEDVYNLWSDEYIVIGEYIGDKKKIEILHAKCKCKFMVTPNNFLCKHSTCPICANRIIIKGINDIATTNPFIADYMLNEEDKYKYSKNSNKKVDWKCPHCNTIVRNKSIDYMSRNGFHCPNCSDGISFPNKFAHEVFKQLYSQISNYEYEYSPDWIKPKRYDNYFEYNNIKYIVEIDGGLGHGKYVIPNSKKTLEYTIEVDEYKNRMAKEHGINIIRIDVENDNDKIKNCFLKSKLNDILDLSNVDWNVCFINALSSKKVETIKLFNEGIKNTTQISQMLDISVSSVEKYLKSGTNYGLCNYNPKDFYLYRDNSNLHTRKVICLNTKHVFNSIVEACILYNIKSPSNITACCIGYYKSAGRDINNEKLRWMYYDDYLELSDYLKDNYMLLDRFKPKCKNKRIYGISVINLETLEIFQNANEAARHYHKKDGSYIRKCVKNKNITAFGYHWMDYEDYCTHGSFLIQQKLNK